MLQSTYRMLAESVLLNSVFIGGLILYTYIISNRYTSADTNSLIYVPVLTSILVSILFSVRSKILSPGRVDILISGVTIGVTSALNFLAFIAIPAITGLLFTVFSKDNSDFLSQVRLVGSPDVPALVNGQIDTLVVGMMTLSAFVFVINFLIVIFARPVFDLWKKVTNPPAKRLMQ